MRAVTMSAQAAGGAPPLSPGKQRRAATPSAKLPLPARAAAPASSSAAATLTQREPVQRNGQTGVEAGNIVALPGRGAAAAGASPSVAAPAAPAPTAARRRLARITPATPILSGGGGGLFFFWQLGAIDFISRHYDLSRVAFRGASAGGLVVTLAACGVPAETALTAAHELAVEHDLFDRPLGAAGVFGRVVRAWLHDLLPDDAVDRCGAGRLKLVVTPLTSLTLAPATVDCFTTKDELVDACLASAHVPFFLDGKPAASYRGRAYVDGSFQDFFTRGNSDALSCGGGAYVLDYLHDDQLETGRLDFLKLRDLDGARELMATGAAYARRQMEAGALDLHFGEVRIAGTAAPATAPSF